MKTCRKCGKRKSVTKFRRRKAYPYNYYNSCNECERFNYRLWYKKNKDKVSEYNKKYYQREDVKTAGREKSRKAIKKYPEKYKARYNTRTEIKFGRLKRKPCYLCNIKKTEAHHLSYDNKHNVVFLCTEHHHYIHRLLKTKERAMA